ncbi:hypothetical protein FA13DRAFT_1391796 [Coprinellus micaceus]|uniref:Uncharacterized protein n=1 Tax=Coprinellus micaceus TaxID=71717 RepID=A0A4Y7SR64_COPMI|nr:hypothetical protein FA13DRAFT_1391796 [Coprinellus micaceus]
MSSGQFIVPVTIIRWVESGLPQSRLDDILQLVDNRSDNPFATLDALYHHILKRANNPSNDPRLVVKWIKCIETALRDIDGVLFWQAFLEDEEGEFRYRLAPITSLISVPGPDDSSARPLMDIRIHHKSFTDFLSSPARCGDLYVDEKEHSSFLSERILVVLKNKGPIIPFPSREDRMKFLKSFFYLDVLFMERVDSLRPLSESSKEELASCDVAWWTALSLSYTFNDGVDPPNDGISECVWSNWSSHSLFITGIYKRIHQAMGVRVGTKALSSRYVQVVFELEETLPSRPSSSPSPGRRLRSEA